MKVEEVREGCCVSVRAGGGMGATGDSTAGGGERETRNEGGRDEKGREGEKERRLQVGGGGERQRDNKTDRKTDVMDERR